MTIPLDELVKNMLKANEKISDFSCKAIYASDNREQSEKTEKSTGYSPTLPYLEEERIWVKRSSFMMLNQNETSATLLRKVGSDFLVEGRSNRKFPHYLSEPTEGVWPAFPNPECEFPHIMKFAKDRVTHVIDKKKDPSGNYYCLTFTWFKNERFGDKHKCFYVREADWFLFKWTTYIDNRFVHATELKDIKINAGLSDELFKLAGSDKPK